MAAIWKGSVSFGLVNIAVELRIAVRADHISFRLLQKEVHRGFGCRFPGNAPLIFRIK